MRLYIGHKEGEAFLVKARMPQLHLRGRPTTPLRLKKLVIVSDAEAALFVSDIRIGLDSQVVAGLIPVQVFAPGKAMELFFDDVGQNMDVVVELTSGDDRDRAIQVFFEGEEIR